VPTPPVPPASPSGPPPVEIRTSRRRTRTVSARWEKDRVVVLAPSAMPRAERERVAAELAEQLVRRIERARARSAALGDHAALQERARRLAERYLDGQVAPSSVTWVANQRHRWGSTTPATGAIRLSQSLLGMPDWVVDSVIVHELAHLAVPDHGPAFRALVERYPRTEQAKAFLDGVTWARAHHECSGGATI
jgi:predicted metal-dependent hydrolase